MKLYPRPLHMPRHVTFAPSKNDPVAGQVALPLKMTKFQAWPWPTLRSVEPFLLQLKVIIHIKTRYCYVTSSAWVVARRKTMAFLYSLSFPSLIESQTKVKQYKGFFVSYKKHLSKHIVRGHVGAINNPLRPASRLWACSSAVNFSPRVNPAWNAK